VPGCVVVCKLQNIYVVLLIVTTLWMGTIGFIDDYIKIFKRQARIKRNFKVFKQVGLLIVGAVLFQSCSNSANRYWRDVLESPQRMCNGKSLKKITATTIPFFKNNEFDYAELLAWTGEGYEKGFVIFYPGSYFIITAVSNGANLTE
jgi:phospho-N-acetylmuramoyl-pentapeptide-transferase